MLAEVATDIHIREQQRPSSKLFGKRLSHDFASKIDGGVLDTSEPQGDIEINRRFCQACFAGGLLNPRTARRLGTARGAHKPA